MAEEDTTAGPLPTSGAVVVDLALSTSSDLTGTETFARFVWQAKHALLHWLTCLGEPATAPHAVLCEELEDIAIVHPNHIRLIQLKTRDRGSWSAATVCTKGHGIDALIRSYKACKGGPLETIASYELWLEGPSSSDSSTAGFFRDPTTANEVLRKKLRALGLRNDDLNVFLQRLRVVPQQPPRSVMDAVVLQYIGALWPGLTDPEKSALYEKLLLRVELAQANEESQESFAARIRQAFERGSQSPAQHHLRVLTREHLQPLVPPLVSSSNELLELSALGEKTTALERKLRGRGASARTLELSEDLRAKIEIRLQKLTAARPEAWDSVAELEDRVLIYANAVSAQVGFDAVANPAAAARPAEAIAAKLLTSPGELASLDVANIIGQDPYGIYGLLCRVSDECRYGWGIV